MHYVTRGSHWMRKHKFDITCLDVFLIEFIVVTADREKLCVSFLRPRMHYVTRRSHWKQKLKFG
jgi:hypothetical protein